MEKQIRYYLIFYLPPPLYAKEFELEQGENTIGTKADITLQIPKLLPLHFSINIKGNNEITITSLSRLSDVNLCVSNCQLYKCELNAKCQIEEDADFYANGLKFAITSQPGKYTENSIIYTNKNKIEEEPNHQLAIMYTSANETLPWVFY